MKNLLLLLLFASTSASFCQVANMQTNTQEKKVPTAKEILELEIVKILQDDGILLKENEKACVGDCRNLGLWKNEYKKKNWIKNDEKLKRRFINIFKAPSFCADKTIVENLTFHDKSIGLIGSYIIRNNDLSIINNSISPVLPVLENENQTSIPNPSQSNSNYLLNYTTNNFFQADVESGLSSDFQDFYSAKLAGNVKITDEKRNQISIGAGVFENRLAKVFNDIEQIGAIDFEPIFNVWTQYKKGNILPNDKIIKSFEGMCYFSSEGVDSNNTKEVNAEASSSGKYPFLSYNLNTKTKWTDSNNTKWERNIYHVFMFKQPEFINVPSKEQIIKCWNNLKPSPNSINLYISNNIPANGPLIIKAKFGPIPNKDVLTLIKVDEKYTKKSLPDNKKFIKSINLITDSKRLTNDGEYYTFDIEIERDENVINQNSNLIGSTLSANLPFRIYYDNPIGNDTLDLKYTPINLKTELFPTPTCDYQLNATKELKYYKYNTTIDFNTANQPITIVSNPKPPKVIDVFGLPTSIDQSFKKFIIESSLQLKTTNKYILNFSIPVTNNYFNVNQRSYEIEVLLEFYTNDGTLYKRRLPVELLAPKEMIEENIASTILINGNGELINSLNLNAYADDTTKISELINKSQIDGNIDILGFIEKLKEKKIITLTPTGSYIVPVNLIDFNLLKK